MEEKYKRLELKPNFKIPEDLLEYLPEESAKLYKIIPISFENNVLHVGAVKPEDIAIRDALNFVATRNGIEYKIEKIDEEVLKTLLTQYTDSRSAITDALDNLENQSDLDGDSVILGVDDSDYKNDENLLKEEAPVIKLVSNILLQAVQNRASDIHIEPREKESVVRFRIDGELQQVLAFPKKAHNSIVARIKLSAQLKLDERRRPQDGRFSALLSGRRIDFRVSSFPLSDNEKVILRVLDKKGGLLSLKELGLSDAEYKKVLEATKRPYGLILSTGPTGAGKTTTLYALLNEVDKKTQNIISLEDPIEYSLEGINQSNIKPDIGYTFATGLRSVLRGDPDQILVGEIRDKETAHLAIQAALTGHTVYSTIHTNTAVGAISRLINFGIDPFLLAPTLSLIVGQRIVRTLDGAGEDVDIGEPLKKVLAKQFADLPQKYASKIPEFKKFKRQVGTESNPSGLKGRIGVFEVLNIDDEIRGIILGNGSENDVYKSARNKGMTTFTEDAIIKGIEGSIPYSEIAKINNELTAGLSLVDESLPEKSIEIPLEEQE